MLRYDAEMCIPDGTMWKMMREALPLTGLTGVGPKTAEAFSKLGITDIPGLLASYPADYDRMDALRDIASLSPGQTAAVKAVIMTQPTVRGFGKNAVLSIAKRYILQNRGLLLKRGISQKIIDC